MYLNIWEFYVKTDLEKQFEQANGSAGEWYQYFKRSPDFLGTGFLRGVDLLIEDKEEVRRYLTEDRWRSIDGFRSYVKANPDKFQELSDINDRLVVRNRYLGFFQSSF